MRFWILFVAGLVAASPAAAGMSASFEWGPTKKCFDTNSPPFKVSGVPKGTVKLGFKMTDLDAPQYRHGGGKVEFTGKSQIPYGAFRYKGPCPPTRHKYRFTITALDEKGKEIGKTTATRSFP